MFLLRFSKRLFASLVFFLVCGNLFAAGRASHVIVVVWDGMRPDFVTEQGTPNLYKLAHEGVVFKKHHPAYLSTTEVNGTEIATGMYPAQSDLVGNKEFRPKIDPLAFFATESLSAIRKGDELSGGHYLAFPTMAEIVQAHGRATAVAGSKGVAILQDRAERAANSRGEIVFQGRALPEDLTNELYARLGDFPALKGGATAPDLWTTRALIGSLWAKGVPALSVLWMGQPDISQHATSPGSEVALAAIKGSDDDLGRVLAALDEKKARDETDVILVSDHGFSTIEKQVDVAAALNANGFRAFRKFPAGGPQPGDIMVIGNGGAAFLYVTGHDRKIIARAAHVLQEQPYAGVVLTRNRVPGTFRLRELHMDSADAPDLVLAMRWQTGPSANGTPGLVCSDAAGYPVGHGMHGSLSPFDMHNTCIAAGPDFRRGAEDDLPTGNIDIAPTVLWILGITPPHRQSGRVLHEAMVAGGGPAPRVHSHRLETSYRNGDQVWRQYLKFSEVDGVRYFDQGNGEQIPAKGHS